MKKKGAVSFPMMIVVSIIILVIIIALYYIFLKNTEAKIEDVFGILVTDITVLIKSLLGPVGNFL